MKKVILVVLDGLNYETAKSRMGYLNHLTESNKAQFTKVIGELPTLSRPMYETILTGTPVIKHGIVHNDTNRMSSEDNLFKIARRHNLTTATAAYHWVSELYIKSPFNKLTDRFYNNSKSDIQNGIFYWSDDYPDNHLFLDGDFLRRMYNPDFLYIHSMNIDCIGHKYSSNSSEYRNKGIEVDGILSQLIPTWIDNNYAVVITSDHGMNMDGSHGGIEKDERLLPLWIINGEEISVHNDMSQLLIAPIICKLMDISPSENMINI